MKIMVRVTTQEAFEKEAEAFLKTLVPSTEGAVLVALSGELGAGKTTFTQTLARALGIQERVTSPTFVLAKTYPCKGDGSHTFTALTHIDAYRLSSREELEALSFEKLLQTPQRLVVLEWPERVAPLPQGAHHVRIEAEEDGARELTYTRT